MAEQEVTPEQEGIEDEAPIEGLVEEATSITEVEEPIAEEQVTEEAVVKEAVEQTEPQPGHDFSKGLQAQQQEVGNLKRQLEGIQKLLQSQPQQTPAPVEPEPDDPIAKIIATSEDDTDPYGAAKVLAEAFQGLRQELKDAKVAAESATKNVDDRFSTLGQQTHETTFKAAHPDLKDQYEPLKQQAREKVWAAVGGEENATRLDAPTWAHMSAEAFDTVVTEAGKTPDETTSVPKPKTTPDKTTDGAQIVKSKAAASRVVEDDLDFISDSLNNELLAEVQQK